MFKVLKNNLTVYPPPNIRYKTLPIQLKPPYTFPDHLLSFPPRGNHAPEFGTYHSFILFLCLYLSINSETEPLSQN